MEVCQRLMGIAGGILYGHGHKTSPYFLSNSRDGVADKLCGRGGDHPPIVLIKVQLRETFRERFRWL